MSYSLALRRPYALSSLGAGMGYVVSLEEQLPSCDLSITGNATADAAYKRCCEETKTSMAVRRAAPSQVLNEIKNCSLKATGEVAKAKTCSEINTGISYIDSAFRSCCEGAWKGGGNVGERTKKLAVCTANAAASAALAGTLASAATAACVAAGAVTAGITTALAATGICGLIGSTVGVFIYNRIHGYSTQALILGGAAAAVCGFFSGGALALVCGIAIAELVDWISNLVGPTLESIFDPDAAKRRERAERLASEHARQATEKSLYEAQKQIVDQWSASVNRIWDVYESAFPTPAARSNALAALGITNTYNSIAQALVTASQRFPNQEEVDRYGGYDAAQRAVMGGTGRGIPTSTLSAASIQARVASKLPWAGCEIYGRMSGGVRQSANDSARAPGGSYGELSALCPPFPDQSFLDQDYDPNNKASRSADYYKGLGTKYMAIVKDFFTMLPMAESIVANNITTYAAVKRAQDLIDAARASSRSQIAARAAKAASVAEAAADAALKGNAKEGAAAVRRAQAQVAIAEAARKALFGDPSSGAASAAAAIACVQDKDCQKATSAASRAKVFAGLAVKNAEHAATMRVVIGAGVAAGAAGALYMLLRK